MTFPIEAYKFKEFRIFHALGNQEYVLTLRLKRGDNAQTKVLQAFQQGQLPGCLLKPSLEFACLAVRESLSDSIEDNDEDEGQSQEGANLVQSPAIYMDVALDAGLLEFEHLRWPKLLALGKEALDASGSADISAWPHLTKEMIFWRAFDFLLRHRPAFFRTIGTLEESYLKENRELQAGRESSISQLQMRQSIEMENVRQQAENVGMQDEEQFREVQSLVTQHVGELDAVDLHWRTEIEMLKVRQKASYRDLIVDFFEQEIEQLASAKVEHASKAEVTVISSEEEPDVNLDSPSVSKESTPLKESDAKETSTIADAEGSACSAPDAISGNLAQPLRAETSSHSFAPTSRVSLSSLPSELNIGTAPAPGSEDTQSPGTDARLQECCQIRAAFGQQRIFFVIRLWVGDIIDLLHEPPSVDRHGEDDDGAGPQLPPDLVGFGSFGHRYFSRGTAWPLQGVGSYSIKPQAMTAPPGARLSGGSRKGFYRSPSLRFWAPPSPPPPVRLSPNAYAASLRGMIIPTPENLVFETMQPVMLRDFSSRCDQYTDLHFAPLSKQLQLMRTATENAPLRVGDYFCTRHSNLGGNVQAAFHLIIGSSEGSASDEIPTAVHRALRRVVGDCHSCHIAELSFPLLLLDTGTSETSLPYAVAQRRSENALRALKGALTQLADELAPSEPPELGVVNLVLPPACAQSINARMPSVVESTITFLRHSFQCV